MKHQTHFASSALPGASDCSRAIAVPRKEMPPIDPYRLLRLVIFLMLCGFWAFVISILF